MPPQENVDAQGRRKKRPNLKKGAVPTLLDPKAPPKPARKPPKVRPPPPLPLPAQAQVEEVNGNDPIIDPVNVSMDHAYNSKPFRLEHDEEVTPPPVLPFTMNDINDNSDIIDTYVTRIERLENEVKSRDAMIEAMKNLFQPDQVRLMTGKTKFVHWSDKTITICLEIRYLCGETGYKHLIKLGFPFPSIDTLNRRIKELKCKPGIHDDAYALLRMKTKDMDEDQKHQVLVDDEASLKPGIEFDTSHKKLSGYITIPRKNDNFEEGLGTKEKPLEGNDQFSFLNSVGLDIKE